MYEPHANRFNFKTIREKYGISQEDIAAKCKLGRSTISNFETMCTGRYSEINTREYNIDKICDALDQLIIEKEKKSMELVNPNKEKEVDVVIGKKNILHTGTRLSDIKRADLTKFIREFCVINDISIRDFCDMCGVSKSTFIESQIEKNPIMSEFVVRRISEATGWSHDDLKSGSFVKRDDDISTKMNKSERMAIEKEKDSNIESGSAEAIGAKLAPDSHNPDISGTDIQNVKYIYQNGKYIMEYDIVRHVTREISKEKFLNDISDSN